MMTIIPIAFPNSTVAQSEKSGQLLESTDGKDFVRIEGSTNLNSFVFFQKLTNSAQAQVNDGDKKSQLSINIPAHNFEASNPLMYKDFLELIKAHEHPIIRIIIFYNPKEFLVTSKNKISSIIEIKLAGHQQSYTIPGTLHQCSDQTIRVEGSIKLNLNDFNLEPPTKFFGMVKVNDEVYVNFGLTMENDLLTKN
jgi:hypothetical protein